MKKGTRISLKKNELGPDPKIILKWIINIKVKAKLQYIERKTKETLCNFGIGNEYLGQKSYKHFLN
jgi:hypothetical protein